MIVATIRALKMHGGVAKDELKKENLDGAGEGLRQSRAPCRERAQDSACRSVVAVNRFSTDTEAEIALLKRALLRPSASECVMADHWAQGGEGADELAETVVRTIDDQAERFPAALSRRHVAVGQDAHHRPGDLRRRGHHRGQERAGPVRRAGEGKASANSPICVAKTQYSFTTNPDAKGVPLGHIIPIREVRLSAGAEFVVVICGDIMTMPGLPKVPAANNIELAADGRIAGLF